MFASTTEIVTIRYLFILILIYFISSFFLTSVEKIRRFRLNKGCQSYWQNVSWKREAIRVAGL